MLAYSPDGSFDPTAMPEHMAYWINGYQREIASVVEAGSSPSRQVAKEWERWNKGTVRDNSTWVAPLMTSRWKQIPLYNNYCPYDTVFHAHGATGCVATAMAQIMRYWQWPEVGYGCHSYSWSYYGTLSADFGNIYYNWDHMPDTLSNACTNEEIDAVATLMYHAGVAVDMMYHPEGSGAYTWMVRAVLTHSTGIGENTDGPSTLSTGSGTSGAFAFISDGNIIVTDGPSTPSTGSGTSGTYTLQIVDVMGRVIRCTDGVRTVSTAGIPAGVYVLRLIDGSNVKTQKIVIK